MSQSAFFPTKFIPKRNNTMINRGILNYNKNNNVMNEDENEINDNMENNSNIFNINNYNNYMSNKNKSEFQNNNINDNIMNNGNNDNELSNININNNDNLFLKPQKEKEQELDSSYYKLKDVTKQILDELNTLKISKKDQNEFLDYVYQNQKLVNNYEKNKIRIQNELRLLKLNDLLNNSIIVEGMKQLAQLYREHITSAYYNKLPDEE